MNYRSLQTFLCTRRQENSGVKKNNNKGSASIPAKNRSHSKKKFLEEKIDSLVALIDRCEKLPVPEGGDCWSCLFQTKRWKAYAQVSDDSEHLRHHVKEGYLHGSLLENALRWAGYDDKQIARILHASDKPAVKKALRRYLRAKLGEKSERVETFSPIEVEAVFFPAKVRPEKKCSR